MLHTVLLACWKLATAFALVTFASTTNPCPWRRLASLPQVSAAPSAPFPLLPARRPTLLLVCLPAPRCSADFSVSTLPLRLLPSFAFSARAFPNPSLLVRLSCSGSCFSFCLVIGRTVRTASSRSGSHHIASRHSCHCTSSSLHITHCILSHHITEPHVMSRQTALHHRTQQFITSPHLLLSHHITSRAVTSHHLTSRRVKSCHITPHHIASHHVASRHLASRHVITSRHVASSRVKSRHITRRRVTAHRLLRNASHTGTPRTHQPTNPPTHQHHQQIVGSSGSLLLGFPHAYDSWLLSGRVGR